MKSRIINYIFPPLLSLSLLIIIYLPLNFKITEVWMSIPKISIFLPTIFLIIFVLFFNIFDWQKLLNRRMVLSVFLLLTFVSSIFVYGFYRDRKLSLEYLPKIYNVNQSWGIQGTLIEIRGINFWPTWKRGKVFLGDEELRVKSWEESLVIAEQPVMSKFGQFYLYIVREDGVASNKIPFEAKNPNELYLLNH